MAKVVTPPNGGWFKSEFEFSEWLSTIPARVKVTEDCINSETGEVYMEKGHNKCKLAKTGMYHYVTAFDPNFFEKSVEKIVDMLSGKFNIHERLYERFQNIN